jgi:hypothetical protein
MRVVLWYTERYLPDGTWQGIGRGRPAVAVATNGWQTLADLLVFNELRWAFCCFSAALKAGPDIGHMTGGIRSELRGMLLPDNRSDWRRHVLPWFERPPCAALLVRLKYWASQPTSCRD